MYVCMCVCLMKRKGGLSVRGLNATYAMLRLTGDDAGDIIDVVLFFLRY